jgi:iron complex transport system permease protein
MQIDLAYPAALTVGALLSSSGAAMQSLLRNPLAEPYLLGTVGGASLFAVLSVNLGIAAVGAYVMPVSCLLGAAFSLALVSLIAHLAARRRERCGGDAYLRSSSSTIVLAGFVTGSFTGSLHMLALSYADAETHMAITKWLFGSLRAVTPGSLLLAMATLAASLTAFASLSKSLNLMELGRDEAECLGLNTGGTMFAALCAVAVSTAVSVAVAGAIGFVGLVIPHAVRRLTGGRMQQTIPLSAIAGGLVLVMAEFTSRLLPGDVPAGVVAAIGSAPFFLWLISSRHAREGLDV